MEAIIILLLLIIVYLIYSNFKCWEYIDQNTNNNLNDLQGGYNEKDL